MRTRLAVLVPVAGLAVAVLWGSIASGASRSTTIPTAPGGTKPAGTALGNGFTVPKGAVLVGTPLPFAPVYLSGVGMTKPDGWQAQLLVEGEPREVMGALTADAERAGFQVASGCQPSRYANAPAFECTAIGTGDDGRRRFDLSSYRGSTGYGPASHMNVAYVENTTRDSGPDPGGFTVSDEPVSTAPALAKRWPSLAQTGDYLFGPDGEATDSTTGRAPRIEPASTLAAPVGPVGGLQPYSWRAVMKVEGRGREIAERYRRQFAREPDYGQVGKVRRHALAGGVTLHTFSAEPFLSRGDDRDGQ